MVKYLMLTTYNKTTTNSYSFLYKNDYNQIMVIIFVIILIIV